MTRPGSQTPIARLLLEAEETVGGGGFLSVRRLTLRNQRVDGTTSEKYPCDYTQRPYGNDAVVVALFSRYRGPIRVLLRDGLRPGMTFGRAHYKPPVPDERRYLFFTELVAGILENQDQGMAGIRARAAMEVAEESGYQVRADDVVMLGAGSFPAPGVFPEKLWLTAAEILDEDDCSEPAGDGSAMEEGASIRWVEIDQAIADCVRGELADMKTEVTLRRLRDYLAAG